MTDGSERQKALLSIRSAFILVTSLGVAFAVAGLTYAIHHSLAWSGLAAGSAFAAAAAFLNWVVDLFAPWSLRYFPAVSSLANGKCAEVASLTWCDVGFRNSRDPEDAVLAFTPDEWHAFLGDIQNGEFNEFSLECSGRSSSESIIIQKRAAAIISM